MKKRIKLYNEYLIVEKSISNKSVPDIIKDIIEHVQNVVNFNESFSKLFDYSDNNYFPIKFNIIYNIDKNSNLVDYISDVNIIDVIKDKDIIDISVNIKDKDINIDKILSLIHHELRHIYDILTINSDHDIDSFLKIPIVMKYKNPTSKFGKFIHLVYLSLEHELVARNSMIYHKLRNIDKDKILDKFKDTYIYKSLLQLNNFDVEKFISEFNIDDLLKITNDFIYDYKGYNKVNNKQDLIEFYSKWKEYFHKKSEEYYIEALKMIDDIKNDINKPIIENKYHSYQDYINVKQMFENIKL